MHVGHVCVSLCSCVGPLICLRAWECIDFFNYSLLTLRRKESSGLEKNRRKLIEIMPSVGFPIIKSPCASRPQPHLSSHPYYVPRITMSKSL